MRKIQSPYGARSKTYTSVSFNSVFVFLLMLIMATEKKIRHTVREGNAKVPEFRGLQSGEIFPSSAISASCKTLSWNFFTKKKREKISASAAPRRSPHIRQNHVEASAKMSKYNYRKQLLNQLEAERCLTKFTSAPPGVFLDLVLHGTTRQQRGDKDGTNKTGLRGWKRE